MIPRSKKLFTISRLVREKFARDGIVRIKAHYGQTDDTLDGPLQSARTQSLHFHSYPPAIKSNKHPERLAFYDLRHDGWHTSTTHSRSLSGDLKTTQKAVTYSFAYAFTAEFETSVI